MKMKYSVAALVAAGALTSCTADLMNYEGGNMVRFGGEAEAVYSFAYYADSKTEDELEINILTVGEVADHPRTVNFEQIKKEWKYNYDPNDGNKIIDSTYVDMEFPAVEGTHFHIQNAPNNLLTIPAGENQVSMKILLKRSDKGLKKNARKLYLKLIPNGDFGIISETGAMKKITISDKLEKPRRWKRYYPSLFLGDWSEVKHRFMINVTGQKWDDDFLKNYVENMDEAPLRKFYIAKIKQALKEYNANPKNNPPMKDENGKEIVFP